jgi:hypothetical protein
MTFVKQNKTIGTSSRSVGIAGLVLGAGALLLPMTSHADFVSFAGSGPAGATLASNTATFGSITATATGNSTGQTFLTQRNASNERGLGVCSRTADNRCVGDSKPNGGIEGWGGDQDELDNAGTDINGPTTTSETITLTTTSVWGGLFAVSSLDGNEGGVVKWFNSSNTLLGSVAFGTGFDANNGATISRATNPPTPWGGLTGTEVNTYVLDLTGANGWNPNAAEVVFSAGGEYGEKNGPNDYMVAGASVVPIPAAVWLFGSALVGFVGLGRRAAAARAA